MLLATEIGHIPAFAENSPWLWSDPSDGEPSAATPDPFTDEMVVETRATKKSAGDRGQGGRGAPRRSRGSGARWGLVLPLALALVLTPLMATAQPRRAILWLPSADPEATVSADEVGATFAELLETATDSDHLVGVSGLAGHMANEGMPIPGCLMGVEACDNPVREVAELLRIDVIAWVTAHGSGERLVLEVQAVGGGARQSLEFTGRDLRETAFRLVTEFVGASGELAVTSRPTGAVVRVDGREVGSTPFQGELAAGIYEVDIDLEGYDVHTETVEILPDQTRLLDLDLSRRYADLTLSSPTPGARFVIGDTVYENTGETVHLEPGMHVVRVEAPGHNPEERTVNLVAGREEFLSVALVQSPEAIRERNMGYIYQRPMYFRGGITFAGHGATLAGATGPLQLGTYEVQCVELGAACDPEGLAVNAAGLDFELGYSFRVFEVTAFGVGYSLAQIGGVSGDGRTLAVTTPVAGGDEVSGRVETLSRFQLNLPRVGARWLFDDHWSVFARTGFSWYTDQFEVVDIASGIDRNAGNFSRAGWLWSLDLGGRYHLNDTLFLAAAFFLAADLSWEDAGLGKGFSVSLGITWEDLFAGGAAGGAQ
jgi:hypothetical protein